MKLNRLAALAGALLLASIPLAAEESGLNFSTSTDFAYYPKSLQISTAKNETKFAPITGAYSGLEGRITAHLDKTVATPLGTNWLVSGATVKYGAALEITPVSAMPIFDITFTPVPFIVFNAGMEMGTGWNLLGMQGMGTLAPTMDKYDDQAAGSCWFAKWWAQGTFQFDLGAVMEGDWTHLQFMYTYQLYYQALTNVPSSAPWIWQCAGNRLNGLYSWQNIILAYQLPNPVVSRVGFVAEFDSLLKCDPMYDEFKYTTISLSPMAQFKFGKKDTLTALLGFKIRQSYAEAETDWNDIQNANAYARTPTGSEFFFNRIALSWSHQF